MVDVTIHAWSKPFQTLCTLKSLLKHSGQHIDNIYLTVPKGLSPSTNIIWIQNYFTNLIMYHAPVKILIGYDIYDKLDYTDENNRLSLPFQHGFEKSDKKYVFVTHADNLYTGDVIGHLLGKIEDAAGIGLIGMCWNCPMNYAGFCDHNKFETFRPTYSQVLGINNTHPFIRKHSIDREHPMPLPECRLNEWSCLIDREKLIEHGFPYFGLFGNADFACKWFHSMVVKGHRFINDYMIGMYKHGFWADGPGMTANELNIPNFVKAEHSAEKYFKENFDVK